MTTREEIRVVTQDGQYLGRLEHVAANRETGRATGLVIERNGDRVLVPLDAVRDSQGKTVTLEGTSDAYRELPLFNRYAYRLLDQDMETQEMREWMESMGIEDFQIGEEDIHEKLPDQREVHTGAENPYRSNVKANGNGRSGRDEQSSISDDSTDMNEPTEEVAERTRSDKR